MTLNRLEQFAIVAAAKKWMREHKASTHAIAVAAGAAILAFNSSQPFHDAVLQALGHAPKWVLTALTLAGSLYAWYRNGEKLPPPPQTGDAKPPAGDAADIFGKGGYEP